MKTSSCGWTGGGGGPRDKAHPQSVQRPGKKCSRAESLSKQVHTRAPHTHTHSHPSLKNQVKPIEGAGGQLRLEWCKTQVYSLGLVLSYKAVKVA